MRDIIFIGDGIGVRTYPAQMLGLNVIGTDISKWAVEHSLCKNNMIIDDISETQLIKKGEKSKLIVLYDICEHLTDKQLDKCLKNIIQISNNYVFSIPFIGDPNLEADNTHIQKKTKKDWIKLIQNYGIVINPTPNNWMFKEQILVGTKK